MAEFGDSEPSEILTETVCTLEDQSSMLETSLLIELFCIGNYNAKPCQMPWTR